MCVCECACSYVNVCIYVCACVVCVRMCVYTCTCTYVCAWTCTNVFVGVHVCVCSYVYVGVGVVDVHVDVCLGVYVCTYVCVYRHLWCPSHGACCHKATSSMISYITTTLPLSPIPLGTRSLPNAPYSAPLPNTSLRRTSPSCTSTQTTRDSLLQLTCWGLPLRKAACSTQTCKGCTSLSSLPQISRFAVTMKYPLAYSENDGSRQCMFISTSSWPAPQHKTWMSPTVSYSTKPIRMFNELLWNFYLHDES